MSGLHKFTTKHVGRVSDDVCHLLRTSGCFGKAIAEGSGRDARGNIEEQERPKQTRDFGVPGGVECGCQLSQEERLIAIRLGL